ncbi:MAG: hypothetical protein H5T85_06470 [Actinobacteria bacterium]|nr:hypothetical protein [Actinomycetota bacterium]
MYTYTTSLNPNPKNITVDGNETISVVNTKCTYSVTVNKSGLEWDYKSTWPFYWADSAIFTLTGPEGPNSQVRSITLDNCWFTSNPSSYTWYGLPAGSYTLEESYPDGNNFNYTSNISFPQSFDLGPSKTFNVVNSTEQITGSITVEKTGLEGNDKAIFSLSGPGGPYPDITLGNGESDGWSNLPYGSYTITESYPSGNVYTYTTNLSSDPIVINSDNENPTISVTNTSEKGSITVEKTDATDGSVLAGSTFALFKADGVTPATDAYGNTIPNQVTGVDGKAYFTNLAFGTYVVKEIGAPTGYGLADPVTVEVGGESGADVSIVISDPRIPGSVTINKINSSTGATMSGIGFTIYYKASGNPVYPEAFTNGSGLVTFSGLPWGTYTIVETTPPSGYTAASPVDITITKDNALVGISITLSNTPVPPPPTPPTTTTTTTTTPTLAVAGVATPFLEVLGVSELPFTGLHPVIPIAAITLIIGGLVLIILAIKKREKEVKELR